MIRKSALAATIAALLNPVVADALGLGNIEVSSALNEPLKARIPLRGVAPDEIDELKAALGTDDQFSRAGLNRNIVLTRLRFKVVQDGGTGGHIEVTSHDPIAEPFLNFLVDVNWAKGRVLREYTVLLDPPVYGAAIRSATSRKVATVGALPSTPAPAPAPAPAMAASGYSASSAPGVAPMAAASTASSGTVGDSYGPVNRGETLWSIADKVRPPDASIQSMMLALLRANPQAFNLDNVNALKTGAVLRIPAASEVRDDKAQALAEVARQHGLWDEYRQSIAASVQPQPGGAAVQSAPPPKSAAGSSSAEAMARVASGSQSSAVLKLVGSGTTGAATGASPGDAANVQALRDDLSVAQEEAEAAKLENTELKSRLGELGGIVDDMKRLVELKESQLAALQTQLMEAQKADAAASTKPAEQEVEKPATEPATPPISTTTPEIKTVPAPPPIKVTPKPPPPIKVTPKPVPPVETSFLDDLQAMLPVPLWTILAGLGTLFLGFGGMRMARARKATAVAAADVAAPSVAAGGSLIDQYAQTELPARDDDEDDDDATQLPSRPAPDAATEIDDDKTLLAPPAGAEAGTGTADDDPLAEVNVYLAYERFDQAEQLVRDAIETYPERAEYQLKLLEVFYAAKNAVSFESAAEQLQSAVGADNEMMSQAHAWWNELGTGRELFSADDGPSTADNAIAADDDADLFDVTAADAQDQTGVDFDLGFGGWTSEGQEGSSGLDFDLGAVGDSPADDSLDFDLGGLADADDAAGDSTAPQVAIAAAAAAAALAASTDVDFDLGFGDAEQAPAGEWTAESSTTGLDFNLDADDANESESASLAAGVGDDDSDLDFDLGGLDDAQQAPVLATDAADDDGLDFTLDDEGTDSAVDLTTDLASSADQADDNALDFDLGDTATLASATRSAANADDAVGGADDELDLQLDAAGDDDDFSLGLDMDADANDGAGGLDFDLGDTDGGELAKADGESDDGSLDFDLGDTNAVDGEQLASADDTDGAAGELELDFDLGETASLDLPVDDVAKASDRADDSDGGLDFDLGDTGAGDGDSDDAALDMGLDLQVDADATDDAPLALDMDFDATDDDSSVTVFHDAMTEISADSELDLDLQLDADDGAAALAGTTEADDDFGLPILDMGEDEEGAGGAAFDTVQLAPDAAQALRGSGEYAAADEPAFGVDTEFRGIFSTDGDDSTGDDGMGTAGSLDFDLGTGLDDLENVTDIEDPAADLEQTQFSLRDVPSLPGYDEEDHTLVLNRGDASGEVDEIQTKLDLAQAYMDMGDTEGARNLLGEVMADGGGEQQRHAREMLSKLS